MENAADIVMDFCRIIDRRDAGLRNGTAMAKLEARAQRWRVEQRRQGESGSTLPQVVRESAENKENEPRTRKKVA